MDEEKLRDGDRSAVEGPRGLLSLSGIGETGTRPPTFEYHSRRASSIPQHICVVTETYCPEINGVALTLARLVSGLRARYYTVSVVHPDQQKKSMSEENVRDSFREDIVVRGLPIPGYQGLLFGLPAGRLLRRLWRNQPPAAVYIATEGPLGWSAVRAAKSLDIPTVSGFHTNFHQYCKHYGVGWFQTLALQYLRWLHNQTECTLVSNEELRAQLQSAGFNNVSILERGVDSQLFTPQRRCDELRREWGVSDRDLVLVCVGRIAAEKNLTLAVEAYRAMKQLNDRIRLVIVGDGPLRAVLQGKYPELIFTGMQTGEQLARHYASGDIFLFPSETETFGNVTLEAMASGLAVIAYNYAGARLHITSGETGVLVRFGDANAFVDSACNLFREPHAVKRIRRQARQYVTHLDWPRVVEKFEALLLNAGGRDRKESTSALTRRGLAT